MLEQLLRTVYPLLYHLEKLKKLPMMMRNCRPVKMLLSSRQDDLSSRKERL